MAVTTAHSSIIEGVLPSAVLQMAEDENVLLSDIDVDCDFCTY